MNNYLLSICFLLFFTPLQLSAQDDSVSELNDIISTLIGEQEVKEIPVFENINEACKSRYVSCNINKEIIGLDFQFANLNGTIPKNITQLKKLSWINFEYNYLSGTIPEGLSTLKDLDQILLNGNFLTEPIPQDLIGMRNDALIDLSQNVIRVESGKTRKKLNIINQVNLNGCRSPDSIFISKERNWRNPTREMIEVDTSAISVKEIEDSQKGMKVVEQMPRFPGCEEMEGTQREKGDCAKEKMLQFIYKNLRYPAIAIKHGLEGMAVLQFVVLENGDIGDVSLIVDPAPGGRLGNSGQWIVNRMNYLCDQWTPGLDDGEPVRVLYTLPIKYKLE